MRAGFLAGGLFVAALPVAAQDARPLTLGEAYAAASARSEAVAQSAQTLAQATAQIDELWAAVKPKVSLNGTQMWQDAAGGSGSFPIPTSQPSVAFNGHQSLFSGLREFLALRAARAGGTAAALRYRRARQLLYQDVAGAYLDLLERRLDVATREAQVALTGDRVKELRGFERIGRSRTSEVLAARSQVAQAQADLEASRGRERLSQAQLRFLTGLDADLAPRDVAVPAAVGDASVFLSRARTRPDVAAAREDLESSDAFVSMQKRQYWPSVALDGNYYLQRPDNVYRNVRWDATLTGQWPLYTGGAVGAQVREARARRRYNEAALSLAERRAELETRSALSDLASALSSVQALDSALRLAQDNAKAQAEDYRHGQVTNLEVLNSLTEVEDTRLRLDQARLQAYDARVRLEVAAGGPEEAR